MPSTAQPCDLCCMGGLSFCTFGPSCALTALPACGSLAVGFSRSSRQSSTPSKTALPGRSHPHTLHVDHPWPHSCSSLTLLLPDGLLGARMASTAWWGPEWAAGPRRPHGPPLAHSRHRAQRVPICAPCPARITHALQKLVLPGLLRLAHSTGLPRLYHYLQSSTLVSRS